MIESYKEKTDSLNFKKLTCKICGSDIFLSRVRLFDSTTETTPKGCSGIVSVIYYACATCGLRFEENIGE